MTLIGDGHEDGNSNIYDDALEEDHGEASCYYQARTGPGYETQHKKNYYSRGNAYFRSGGKSSSGGECYALLRMRPLSRSCAGCSVVISCGKVDYDKSG
jgi:hypothetical protein